MNRLSLRNNGLKFKTAGKFSTILLLLFFLKHKSNMPTPKHTRQLTTWQVFCQVERKFQSRELNRQPLPWDLGISPLSSSSLGRIGPITNHFRGVYKMCPNLINKNRKMSTCNRLDLGTLGYRLVMPKNLLGHWSEFFGNNSSNKQWLLTTPIVLLGPHLYRYVDGFPHGGMWVLFGAFLNLVGNLKPQPSISTNLFRHWNLYCNLANS